MWQYALPTNAQGISIRHTGGNYVDQPGPTATEEAMEKKVREAVPSVSIQWSQAEVVLLFPDTTKTNSGVSKMSGYKEQQIHEGNATTASVTM